MENQNFYDGKLAAFAHPTTGFAVLAGRDFAARKAMCSELFNLHGLIDFKWANQAWCTIGRSLMEHCYAPTPKSGYSDDYKQLLANYTLRRDILERVS